MDDDWGLPLFQTSGNHHMVVRHLAHPLHRLHICAFPCNVPQKISHELESVIISDDDWGSYFHDLGQSQELTELTCHWAKNPGDDWRTQKSQDGHPPWRWLGFRLSTTPSTAESWPCFFGPQFTSSRFAITDWYYIINHHHPSTTWISPKILAEQKLNCNNLWLIILLLAAPFLNRVFFLLWRKPRKATRAFFSDHSVSICAFFRTISRASVWKSSSACELMCGWASLLPKKNGDLYSRGKELFLFPS